MGEKFSTNPATGTGSLSVPLATSPGRAGFELGLALSYDSGAGNGPFGLGWNLSTPSITRKTDKGLPRYLDGEASDVFILSGAEDLVPVRLREGCSTRLDIFERDGYRVQRYRPRTEGLFARIERWTDKVTGEVHWQATTRDNVLNVYGKSPVARIADPEHPERIFSWLLEETRDDKGNVARYTYKAEDGAGVDSGQASESNRFETRVGGTRAFRITAQRYLKRIQYGNRVPVDRNAPAPTGDNDYLFEVIFDYGEHHETTPTPAEVRPWPVRPDPFSSYRATFEVRTYRLCRRVLMFHRFAELGPTPSMVRSTDFTYDEDPVVTYLAAVTQAGYKRAPGGNAYERATLPPLELGYAKPVLHDELRTVDSESLAGIPGGVPGVGAQWVDLDGEGIPGVLVPTERAWLYKANLGHGHLAPPAPLRSLPAPAGLSGGTQQLTDLEGNGQLDLVQYAPPLSGYFERTPEGGWAPFMALRNLPNIDWNDPNLRFLDMDGDGHADVLITEHEAFVWYRSRAKEGFEPAVSVTKPKDELKGPAVIFADGTETIQLADMSGDGLVDIVRVRNGHVCYWPNLGLGRFGRRVTLDNSPSFDAPEKFDPKRIRFADIDGSGTSDIVYLGRDGVRLYFNHSGNALSVPTALRSLPQVDSLSSLSVVDLLGQGTACLVWSSPLPGNATRPLAYVDLMGGKKPHVLESVVNNLGAETRIAYAPSTKFYLQDKAEGRPWLTRLAFPVHVIERIERYDHVAKSKFVTRFAYHHGYFNGHEREFRGFACVEQWDAESFSGNKGKGLFPELPYDSTPGDEELNLPPVRTITWFHTGAWLERERLELALAKEYYDKDPQAPLLPDTTLPAGLSILEEREAARALRGQVLRQEVYAEDGTPEAIHPYTISERDYELRLLQHAGDKENAHAVFFVHPRHTLNLHYERKPNDPRIQHEVVLEVDDFGNVTQSAALAYPRRVPAEPEQARLWATLTTRRFANRPTESDWYRVGVPVETITSELTGLLAPTREVLSIDAVHAAAAAATEIPYEAEATGPGIQRRAVERERRLYYRDDLGGPLPLGHVESRALTYETYRLALTPGLVAQVYGTRVSDALLQNEGRYVQQDGLWWAPSGRAIFDPARFYVAVEAIDPFGQRHQVRYDPYALLALDTEDPLHNRVTVGLRDTTGNVTQTGNDYRVLAPCLLTDANRNRTAVAFDALGMVVATAVMGKEGEGLGDLLEGFNTDLPLADVQRFIADPHAQAASLLGMATTRIIYDLGYFRRTGQPPFAASLARETHVNDPSGSHTKIQISFSYSDGFGREIQKKIQAEPGNAPQRQPPVPLPIGDLRPGDLVRDAQGKLVRAHTPRRWGGTGRTVFNNKGKPVRQYEPFFSATHLYEPEREMTDAGVSAVLFYDPVARVVATLHPNHTYEKIVFGPWQQTTYDVNDTVAPGGAQTGDPRTDEDIKGYVRGYFKTQPTSWQTWYTQRISNQLGAAERNAAQKAVVHADTPTIEHLDALGRAFVTLAHNKHKRNGMVVDERYATRVKLDIENNQHAVSDAKGRVVMRYDYDLLGNRIHQASMEAGERWTLVNAASDPIRTWDSRHFLRRMTYDELRRPACLYVTEKGAERLAERIVYGEGLGDAANHRTQVYQHFDGAGIVTNVAYDFKGNPRASRRDLLPNYRLAVNWLQNPAVDDGGFTSSTTYDALNRPLTVTSPDGSVYRPTFNEANLLDKVDVHLRGAAATTPFVTNIDYDAKGQRERIGYGNGALTTYEYDPLTFRLKRLKTTRPASTDTTASELFLDTTVVQDLHYTYDPVGNITRMENAAIRTLFHDGQQIDPVSDYTYDAIYRLIEAHSREHIRQTVFDFNPSNGNCRDYPFIGRRVHPNDLQALRMYTERYEYDAVGNLDALLHRANGSGWTRSYDYDEDSLLEGDKKSNRLTRSFVGNGLDRIESYTHDAHGNMTTMPHMAAMVWNFEDQLQRVDLGGGGTAYYVYDAAGQRVRKVVESQTGTRRKERLYLGGFEVYREYDGDGVAITVERESLHVLDDKQRIALVETQTIQNEDPVNEPEPLQRYQFGNHLESASVELDKNGALISYEEYHPYGTTSFQAGRSAAEVHLKRYRYTVKERDEETGFSYHGARYYVPWLGRWASADPLYLKDATNVYVYALNNPVIAKDPTGGPAWLIPVAIYLGYKALTSAGETAVEAGIAKATSDKNFSVGGTFAKNMLVNSTIGLIPGTSEAKIGVKAAVYGAKLALRTTADATLETAQGEGSFSENFVTSGLGNVGGDILGAGLKKGVQALTDRAAKEAAEKAAKEAAEKAAKEAAEKAAKEAAEKAAKEAAEKGFSAAELAVVEEVRKLPLDRLRAAFEAGGAELKFGGRTIVVEPSMPASGMTLFGENGFVLGREAFTSNAELTKTLLHETHRLMTSQSAAGVTGSLVTQETSAAFSFAERAYGVFFK